MKRTEFLKSTCAGILCGSTIIALLEACSKEDSATPSAANVDFTLDLNDAANQSLKTAGNFKVHQNVIIANIDGTTFVALSSICTHSSCTVSYQSGSFPCPCHGSRFDQSGAVLNGPAASPLKKYSATLSGNNLHVKG